MANLLWALMVLFATAFSPPQVTDREIPLHGATTLRLNVSGSIHLVPSLQSTTVGFHVIDDGPSIPPMTVNVSRSGRMLIVSITGPSQGFLPFTGASGYEIRLQYPPSLHLDVREFAGRLHVDRVSAPMQLYNEDGNIVVDAAPSALTAQADSGNITVVDARARLTLSTINGDIDARLSPRWAGRLIRIETQRGQLHLAVPSSFRAHFDVTTASGSVTNPFRSEPKGPLVFILAERGNITVSSL